MAVRRVVIAFLKEGNYNFKWRVTKERKSRTESFLIFIEKNYNKRVGKTLRDIKNYRGIKGYMKRNPCKYRVVEKL